MTRPIVGASALGIAQAAYEWTLEYLYGREEGGVPLLFAQRVQQTLADVATEIESARLLVQRASWMGRNGRPMTGGQGSMSKLKAGDVTMWATTTLMDLVGPAAWDTEHPLEKWFRDAKIYQLFEGTAEIQRMVISRMQAREYAERLGFAAEIAAEATRPKKPVAERRLSELVCQAPYPRGVSGHDHGEGDTGIARFGAHAWRRDGRTRGGGLWWRWHERGAAGRRGGRRLHHRVTGGARRRRARALRCRLDRPGADRRAARRPARHRRRTFGYQRSEVLAALVNGLTLVAVSVFIGIEAIGRSPTRLRSRAEECWRSASWDCSAMPSRPGGWPAASARTSTSRASCAIPSPTRWARSASSSRARW